MKTRALLTGASGTVGYEALRQLVQDKDRFDVTVFDLKTKKSSRLFSRYKDSIRIFYGDITDKRASAEASRNQDVVIHLAAIIPPAAYSNPGLIYKINTEGTRNILDNVKQFSPNAFFIYSSSVAVYGDRLENPNISVGDPIQPSLGDHYAVTKVEAAFQVISVGIITAVIISGSEGSFWKVWFPKTEDLEGLFQKFEVDNPISFATAEIEYLTR